MQALPHPSEQIWVTPRAIAALVHHVALQIPGIRGMIPAHGSSTVLSKANVAQAISMTKGPQGLVLEVFVAMQRGSALEAIAQQFAERLRRELALALEQPIAEVQVRIQSVR